MKNVKCQMENGLTFIHDFEAFSVGAATECRPYKTEIWQDARLAGSGPGGARQGSLYLLVVGDALGNRVPVDPQRLGGF